MKNTNNLVKKHQSYWVLILALLLSATIQAKVNNYVGAYVQAGEWSLLPSGSDFKASYGVAGGLGFLYELQAGPAYQSTRFLFDVGVGAQYGMTSFKQTSEMNVVLPDQRDLDYDPSATDHTGTIFDYVYEIKDRQDQYTNLAVQIPLMIGVQHRRFYMLAGVKVDANLMTRANTTANISTYGRYYSDDKQVFEDFRNMPEYQFFTNLPQKKSARPTFNLNVNASLEVGGRLGTINYAVGYDVPKRTIECRLAGFVDYGLLDIHVHREIPGFTTPLGYNIEGTKPIYKNTSMVDNLQVNDVMSTSNFADKVNNFMVGLKFTVLFQLPEPGKCVLCNDGYGTSINPRHGGLQYDE